ncbi:MAG: PKD domain-containing protein [Solirubrobacteraceae bacterium]
MTRNRNFKHLLGLAVAAVTLAAAAPAQAAPQWLSPQTLSEPGKDASQQQVAFDQGGDAVAVWESSGGPEPVIMAAARPAGGVFGAAQTLSDPSAFSMSPDVANDAQGDAVAVWLQFDGANARVLAAYRPAGGPFGAPQTLSAAGYEAREPRVAMNAAGEAVIVWSLGSGLSEEAQAASASPGGIFGAAQDLTGFTAAASLPQVTLDSHGDAIAVWEGWDGSKIRIQEASRPAGGNFGAPEFLSPAGENAGTPRVAFDSGGNALAAWRFDGSPASTIQGDYRPVGSAFSAPQTVSTPSSTPAQAPQVAFDAQGDGVVAWQQSDGSEPRIYASVRTPGSSGSFDVPSTLDPGGQEAYEPSVAGDGLSGTIVSWKTFNGATNSTQAAVRPAGGSFGPASTVSATGPQESTPALGIDAQGNGIAVWSRSSGPDYLLEAAGYDAAGPLPRGLTLPSQGLVGQPLQFFIAPLDVWSPVLSEGFSFGDGSSATGVSAVHTYGAPGSYQVTASTTDVLGNTTTVTRTLTIGAPSAGLVATPGTTSCTLSAAQTQRLLSKGTILASVACAANLEGQLSGHLTVRVVSHGAHGKKAKGSSLRGYTLKSTRVSVLAGRRIEVRLSLSRSSLRSVLSALRQHRQVWLYLTLANVKGATPAVHAQTHRAGIVLARHGR